ncbi:hypothetical protein [Nodularia chucula]|uniref:hypothetical protein n=1 Tax=Nodularia chucula TaxID=3093667 RepID=UPI0039C76373
MSNKLFTEVSVAQQETVSGGRFTFNLGGSRVIGFTDITGNATLVTPDPLGGSPTVETASFTDADEFETDAVSGVVLTSESISPSPRGFNSIRGLFSGLFV